MTDFGGVESFRFIPRGVEVNGQEFVPLQELKNCQEARERTVKVYTEVWDEIERLREVLRECEEYFDQRADADHNGISFIPNEEMRLLGEIRDVLPTSNSAPEENS